MSFSKIDLLSIWIKNWPHFVLENLKKEKKIVFFMVIFDPKKVGHPTDSRDETAHSILSDTGLQKSS